MAIVFSGIHYPLTKKHSASNWYVFTGFQTVYGRKMASNYLILPYAPDCLGVGEECAVLLNQSTLHPDFSHITFDVNGFPNGNLPGATDFITNEEMD